MSRGPKKRTPPRTGSPCASERAETIAATAGVGEDAFFGAVSPPIILSSTYAWSDPHTPPTYDYSRGGNPTRSDLERTLAALEGGAHALVTSSGMAAIHLVTHLISMGGLIVAPHDLYGGTHRLFVAAAERGACDVVFVDQNDDAAFAASLAREPALVWLETPSNPLLRVVDIAQRAAQARAAGALVACDNTFLSPLRQNPIALGCDLVVHSTSKFINGHTDVIGGAVIAASDDLAEQMCWWANTIGCQGAPFDSYLTLRGLRTLAPRIEAQERNATAIARALQEHPAVERVYYPGLPDHPDRAIIERQQSGPGALLSFQTALGIDALAALSQLRLIPVAESLGGFETLICHPSTMTHAAMSHDVQANAGITERLLRLSVGIEHVDDLLADLTSALETVSGDRP